MPGHDAVVLLIHPNTSAATTAMMQALPLALAPIAGRFGVPVISQVAAATRRVVATLGVAPA